ncbi:MAG: hypothetical protein K6E83_02420 [Clostridium sp.]|nr:hypothetical protein [Clostridium sp.]
MKGPDMIVTATPKTMTDAEALRTARQGGNVFGKALYGGGEITLKLMYLESREVILDLYYQPAPIMKILGKGEKPDKPSQKIRMIVEGTRCTASYSEDPIETREIDIKEEMLQKTEFPDDKIIAAAKRHALRMVRRQIGRVAVAEVNSMRSIFRPYYVAFYGKYEMGKRIRYLPIEADGHKVERVL